MLDQTIDLSTVTSVVRHGVETEVQEGTFSVGFTQFLNPDPSTGRLVHVSGSSLHPLSYFFVDMQGRRQTGPYHEIQSMVHNTEPPCSRDYTRKECTPQHMEDCKYREPEPPHKLLPVGTRVLVASWSIDDDGCTKIYGHPVPGKIVGYAAGNTMYRWRSEYGPGHYATTDQWAIANNSVQVHPDGPECPPDPRQPKPPTGPRLYVQKRHDSKQGHIVGQVEKNGQGNTRVQVQWYTPGAQPVWVLLERLEIILPSEVHRCPNGQTGDECGSGENQCELCLADEDTEAEAIERSMNV